MQTDINGMQKLIADMQPVLGQVKQQAKKIKDLEKKLEASTASITTLELVQKSFAKGSQNKKQNILDESEESEEDSIEELR